MATPVSKMIDTRKMRYTGTAMAAFKGAKYEPPSDAQDRASVSQPKDRCWTSKINELHEPVKVASGRDIGNYPFTSDLASWVRSAMTNYEPTPQAKNLFEPFSAWLHEFLEKERKVSTGHHNLNVIELLFQVTLEACSEILLAADATDDPVELENSYHSSRAGGDSHFAPWGTFLCGLEVDPPIIVMFPVYLMMCQSFTYTQNPLKEDYVYSAFTGVDWAQGKGAFSERLAAFEKLARSRLPNLDKSDDRSFWRISQAYIRAMHDCENSRPFKSPRKAAIKHNMDLDLIIAVRAVDTLGTAYMANDGAAWVDVPGVDSLTGSALPNDIMDLHTDIKTGETRNLLRLLYPSGLSHETTKRIAASLLAAQLGELFRGHFRARFSGREDGRIAASSPPYSFSRAQHRKVFDVMERYISKYPQFWDWTFEILHMAREQISEASLKETLTDALKRSVRQEPLLLSPRNSFFDIYFDMIENGKPQLEQKQPLGVPEDMAPTIRDIYELWHNKLLRDNKSVGWGRNFDVESDRLFGQAGEILAADEQRSMDDAFKFAIAYGRLSMSLPYIAYHTIDSIILAYGVDT